MPLRPKAISLRQTWINVSEAQCERTGLFAFNQSERKAGSLLEKVANFIVRIIAKLSESAMMESLGL